MTRAAKRGQPAPGEQRHREDVGRTSAAPASARGPRAQCRVDRRDLARDAAHAQAVAAIRRDVHLEDRVVELQVLRDRRPHPWSASASSSSSNPSASSARPSSRAEHSMPNDSTPRSFAVPIFDSARQLRADACERRLEAGARRSARRTRPARSPVPSLDLADAERVGVRVLGTLEHLRRPRRRPAAAPARSTDSTSSPAIVSARPRARASGVEPTKSRNHFS